MPAPRAEAHEDPRAFARAAINEALVPVQHAFLELQRRVDELERRAAAAGNAAPGPSAATNQLSAAPAAYRAAQGTYPGAGASMAPIPVTLASLAPRPPILDVSAIERDANVVIDGALDGRRRNVRLTLTFVLILLVVFGALFAALANSYTPHTSSLEPPRPSDTSTKLSRSPFAFKDDTFFA